MLSVYEGIFQTKEVVIIILVELAVELYGVVSKYTSRTDRARAYQIQNGDFHHALVEVRSSVLDNFHGHDFLCP